MTFQFFDDNITSSVAEQNLFSVIDDKHFATWIFCHNMLSGDTITVKVYVYDENTNTSRVYENRSIAFSDVSGNPAIFIPFVPTTQYRVTLQRTGGSDRVYSWQRIEVS